MSTLRDQLAEEIAILKAGSKQIEGRSLKGMMKVATGMRYRDVYITWLYHAKSMTHRAISEELHYADSIDLTPQRISQIVSRGLVLLQRYNRSIRRAA